MKMKFYLIVLSLLAVCLWGTGDVRAQSASRSMTVTGKVVDQNGAAVTGASVVVVGTTKGTTTGADGAFSLTGVASDARLAVNFIGYKTQTVEVGGRTSFNIVLVEEATAVDEVVVVGYGQVKKSDLTGSVASVKAEKLTDIPANSIDGLLQGRVAGVQVVNSSQDPGASSTVRIRGNSSLNGSNAPLVVIDGFPWGDAGDLKQINPQDIVSMEVLKDASASAIYGSRGANGVILITTRKAQENVTRITLRQQTTVSGFSSELNLWRDPVLMAMLSNESSINAGLTPTYIGATNANGVYYPSIAELQTTWTTNTRWDDLVFRPTPVSNNTTVQVQSSNDRTMFQASANYYLDNGMYIEDTYRKYGGNFSVEHKLLDNLRMKASANITSNKRHNNGGLAYWRNPIFPVYDDNGDYWLYGAQDYSHPLALTNLQKNDSKGLDIISFASVNWDVLPCLNVMAQFNYKHGEQITDKYFPKKYSETGVIELQLASDMVADMSKVRVETLTLSYKATANVASGGTIDFTKGDPQIVVTSPNGESRTYTLEMTEFTETLTGTYTISNLWVYGGTGAAYDCTKLYKPADKSWCWNGEGRGPAAEMDNYLVFTLGEILADGNTTGTCMNWAGEDAKNWDCVFAGASNPDTGKPVDLTQFYRQIPKGESTWLRNYSDGTITFTDADGNKTSCTLVPKGTYQMPNVPPIPLTLESEAFKFNLKGTEDWNNTYNDYGVFARNPVTYYIEIVKQPAGFEVPEASKTIEEQVDPEPEPEPDPEETSLAGTYSVGRLTVYGGSVDPAFVNPVDKSWVWDDSIWKESDNILAMTATGTDDAGRETGECEYLPGEDGGYWNYILKADYNKEGTGALDLTKYYGLLPHGKSAYVYDAEAGTVVFTSGIVSITAKLLREGDYSYGSSTLSVPGIAFDFALPGQTTQGAYPWTDYDRFAVGPRNYVMLFNKQAEAGE